MASSGSFSPFQGDFSAGLEIFCAERASAHFHQLVIKSVDKCELVMTETFVLISTANTLVPSRQSEYLLMRENRARIV